MSQLPPPPGSPPPPGQSRPPQAQPPPIVPSTLSSSSQSNHASNGSQSKVGSHSEAAVDPVEIERLHDQIDTRFFVARPSARETTSLFQQLEIDRILSAFKLNPYEVLEVSLETDEKEINKIYRKKSLLIHPDKVKDPRAVEAFDLLKKASSHLLDQDKRKALDETVLDARLMVLKQLNLPLNTLPEDQKLQELLPSWEERVRKATKELMIDDELRRRKAIRLQHQAEGEVQRKKEQEITDRKRKADQEAAWEANRNHRVEGWRSFQKGNKKKKKADSDVLG